MFLSKTWVSIRTPAEHISGGRIGSRRRLFERQDTRYAQQFRRASTALVRLRSRPSSRSNGNFAHATHPESHRPARICSRDRKSTRLNSSHVAISYAVFCLKKKTKNTLAHS